MQLDTQSYRTALITQFVLIKKPKKPAMQTVCIGIEQKNHYQNHLILTMGHGAGHGLPSYSANEGYLTGTL